MFFHQVSNSRSNNYNAVFYRDIKWDFHFHKSFEIIYVIEGRVHCTVNNIETTLFPGDFGLCLPNDIHSYEPEKNSLYWVCVFSADYVRTFSKQVSDKSAVDFKFKCSLSVENFIKDNLINESKPPLNMLKACLYAICNEYLSSIKLTDADTRKMQNMGIIANFVAEHHKENIKLSDIQKLLDYDYSYISRYFNKTFNMSFNEFLTLHRLETATRLMTETDEKIINIALESGFQCTRTFNDCFKKYFHMSPSEYRKQNITNQKNLSE